MTSKEIIKVYKEAFDETLLFVQAAINRNDNSYIILRIEGTHQYRLFVNGLYSQKGKLRDVRSAGMSA